MKKITVVFGKMRTNLTPGGPDEPKFLTVTRDGVDMELPYNAQVACVELQPLKVFNLAPTNGVVVFDHLFWPNGVELTHTECMRVLKEVAQNVRRKLYECPVQFFFNGTEVSLDEVLTFSNSEIEKEDGGSDDEDTDGSGGAEAPGHDEPEVGAEQQKPRRGRPRK